MSDDLVQGLRDAADWKDKKPYRDAILFRMAADHIGALVKDLDWYQAHTEKLEAALREIRDGNDRSEDTPNIARRALEGK